MLTPVSRMEKKAGELGGWGWGWGGHAEVGVGSLVAACMKLGVDLYKVAIFQKMEQTCASARCHHVQAAVSARTQPYNSIQGRKNNGNP